MKHVHTASALCILLVVSLSLLSGCSSNRGYFRLNQQDDGGSKTNWANTSNQVDRILNK